MKKGQATILGVSSEYALTELVALKTIFGDGVVQKVFANWAKSIAKQALDISLKDNQKRDQLIGLHAGLVKVEKNILEDLDRSIAEFKEEESND